MSVLDPETLTTRSARLAAALRAMRPHVQVLGLLADNGLDWIALDRAAQRSGVTLVPLPAFFTAAQLAHAVQASHMDSLFCHDASLAQSLGFFPAGLPDGMPWHRRSIARRNASPRASKLTFTSGTTGAPKPVQLSTREQWQVAHSMRFGRCGCAGTCACCRLRCSWRTSPACMPPRSPARTAACRRLPR